MVTSNENEKFRRDYAAVNLHDRDLIRLTKKEVSSEFTKNLYANGVPIEVIAKSLNITEEQVKEFISAIRLVQK